MGLSGLEPPTSRLSGVRSNRLSYKPVYILAWSFKNEQHTSYEDLDRHNFLCTDLGNLQSVINTLRSP